MKRMHNLFFSLDRNLSIYNYIYLSISINLSISIPLSIHLSRMSEEDAQSLLQLRQKTTSIWLRRYLYTTLFLIQGSQPFTINGWDFSPLGDLYTHQCSSSVESLLPQLKVLKFLYPLSIF